MRDRSGKLVFADHGDSGSLVFAEVEQQWWLVGILFESAPDNGPPSLESACPVVLVHPVAWWERRLREHIEKDIRTNGSLCIDNNYTIGT